MKDFFSFLKSKSFLRHFTVAFVSLFIVMWFIFKWLDTYTHHGNTLSVPDFTGIKITDLNTFVSDKHVRYVIIDSIYDPKGAKGVVVRQDPEKETFVKDNRTIYLYVSSMLAPMVAMPKLKDNTSLRQAYSILAAHGLKKGKTITRADECNNCVLEQLVKGKKIAPGTMIPKGTVVDLVIGKGLTGEKVKVPYLIGLTPAQVEEKLAEYSLNEGGVTYDLTSSRDSSKAKVYRQIPGATKEPTYNMGGSIDLFYTNKSEKLPAIDSTDTE